MIATLRKIVRNETLVWIVLILVLLVGVFSTPLFTRPLNLVNVTRQSIGLGIVSLAQSFVVIGGGIDLSVGAMISMITTLAATMLRENPELSLLVVIIVTIGTGLAAGALNGFIVVRLGVTPFIATLATMSLFNGVALIISDVPVGGVPRSVRILDTARIGMVPMSIFGFLVILIVAWALARHRRYGQYLYATGANAEIAALTGVRTERIRFFSYCLSGLTIGVASLYLLARLGSGGPTIGSGYELDSITAIVIGGIALSGGSGSILSGFAGVLVLSVFNNIMNLVGVNPFLQILFKGILLLAAVSFSFTRRKSGE